MKWKITADGELIDVTRMTTKGQVVIPQAIRIGMKLKKGDVFVVQTKNGIIEMRKLAKK